MSSLGLREEIRQEFPQFVVFEETGAFPEGNFEEVFFPSLHLAAKRGLVQEITERVEEGADVNAADDQGLTPVAYAAGLGHLPAMATLCALGADLRVRDEQNNSLFHLAAAYDRVEVVKYLASFGDSHPELSQDFAQDAWTSWKNDLGYSVLDVASRNPGEVYAYLSPWAALRVGTELGCNSFLSALRQPLAVKWCGQGCGLKPELEKSAGQLSS